MFNSQPPRYAVAQMEELSGLSSSARQDGTILLLDEPVNHLDVAHQRCNAPSAKLRRELYGHIRSMTCFWLKLQLLDHPQGRSGRGGWSDR